MADLAENPNICASFRPDQLDRNLSYSFLNSLFAKFAVGVVLTSGGIVSAQTQPKANQPVKTSSQRPQQIEPFPLGKIRIADDDTQNPNKPQIRNTGAPLSINEKNLPLYIVEGKTITNKQFQQIAPL